MRVKTPGWISVFGLVGTPLFTYVLFKSQPDERQERIPGNNCHNIFNEMKHETYSNAGDADAAALAGAVASRPSTPDRMLKLLARISKDSSASEPGSGYLARPVEVA